MEKDNTDSSVHSEFYYLGRLCKRGHEHETSGQSLRYKPNRTCVRCMAASSKKFRVAHPDKVAATLKRWRSAVVCRTKETPSRKLCTRCKIIKACKDFYPDRYNLDGLQSWCKSCCSKTQASRLAAKRKPRVNVPVEIKQQKRREAKQRYKRTAKGKVASARQAHKRRIARLQGAHIPYSAVQLAERFAQFNNACAYCDNGGELTIDHVVPLSKRGTDRLENIIPACLICNSSKGNKDACTWYQSKSFYSAERWQHIVDSSCNVEPMALRRAAAKFGLGLGLYEKKPEQRG